MALYFPINFIATTEDPYCAKVILTLFTSFGFLTGKLFALAFAYAAITIMPTPTPSASYPAALNASTFAGFSQTA